MLDNFRNEISSADIEKFVEELIEIFKPEENISKTTLTGLIGELITIYIADDKDKIINANGLKILKILIFIKRMLH